MIRNGNNSVTLTDSGVAKLIALLTGENPCEVKEDETFETQLRKRVREGAAMFDKLWSYETNQITYQGLKFLGFRLLSGSLREPDFRFRGRRGYLVVKNAGQEYVQSEDIQNVFLVETFNRGKFGMMAPDKELLHYLKG